MFDIEDSLAKSRRNVLIISFLLSVKYFLDVKFSSLSVLGITIEADSYKVNIIGWLLWIYFSIRFYQFSNEHRDGRGQKYVSLGVAQDIERIAISKAEEYLFKEKKCSAAAKLQHQVSEMGLVEASNTWKVDVITTVYEPGTNGAQIPSSFNIKMTDRAGLFKKWKGKRNWRTAYWTDYTFPYVAMLLPVLFGFINVARNEGFNIVQISKPIALPAPVPQVPAQAPPTQATAPPVVIPPSPSIPAPSNPLPVIPGEP